jgi:GT2 family glycosyltransferase
MPARVCVAVISYNSEATLAHCLDALSRQTFTDFHLMLIDNASDRRPRTYLPPLPYAHTFMDMTENLGFAGGMNAAIAAASSPLLVALNPDAFAAPEWLAELVAAADRHPETVAFGSLQLSAGDEECIDGFGDHYLATGQAWRGQSGPADTALAYCFGICAAAALYRTDVLRAAGGFDERFFCLYEDVDLSFRLRLFGHQCAVVPSAVVRHVGGSSFKTRSALMQFLIGRNQWWVLLKNMPLILLPLAIPGFFAVEILAAVRGHRPGSLRGLWEGLRRSGEMLSTRRAIQAQRKISLAGLCRWLTWNPLAFLRKASPVKPSP